MQKWKGLFAVAGLGLVLFVAPGSLHAQETDEPEPPTEPAEPEIPMTAPAAPTEDEITPQDERGDWPIYIAVGYGTASADPIDLSNETFNTARTISFLDIDELKNGRFSLGWKLAAGKGDLRLFFNGYEEDSFEFTSTGLQHFVLTPDATPTCTEPDGDPCLLPWWELTIRDGVLRSRRTPPTWAPADDLDDDGFIDQNEVQLGGPADAMFQVPFNESLQNQMQTWDLLYGREFGTRRLTSHWWAGLRVFEYSGNIPSTAWINVDFAGSGFPDGQLIPPTVFTMNASGAGPSAAWSIEWNFFERGIQLFAKGGAAFTFTDIEADSGLFFTLVRDPLVEPPAIIPAPARLNDQRNKSTWQTQATAGARLNLRNGLEFEVAYQINGFLDTILMPVTYNVPLSPLQVDPDDPSANVSAIFSTRDWVVDGFYGKVGFQF